MKRLANVLGLKSSSSSSKIPLEGQRYKDPSAPTSERVENLLSLMTLDEK